MSPTAAVASSDIITGPLEQSYRARSAAFRAASDSTRVTRTHWHIAIANGLGWGFDGNGFSWAVAWLVGFVLWPFVTIGIQQSTGSFAKAFLIVPVAMLLMGVGIWLFTPEHRGKELDAIAI
jgi:hypothetical protein